MNNKREQRCRVLRELLEPYCKAINEHRKDDEPTSSPTDPV